MGLMSPVPEPRQVGASGPLVSPYALLDGMGEVDHWRTLGVGTAG